MWVFSVFSEPQQPAPYFQHDDEKAWSGDTEYMARVTGCS